MERFTYRKKAFTLIELLAYLGIITIVVLLTFILFYAIIFYSTLYIERLTLRTEMYKILQKFYFNSIKANPSSTIPSITNTSITFYFNDNTYEKYYPSSSAIFLENNQGTFKFTSDKLVVDKFLISTSGPFININISLKNLRGDQNINATSVIYIWSF